VGQDDFLAKQYVKEGNFEKAVVFYERLTKKQPNRHDYTEGLIQCYQQMERYDESEALLKGLLERPRPYPAFHIELGYNYALQNKQLEAEAQYQLAVNAVKQRPNHGYGLGVRFQKYALLDWALQAYQLAMEGNPDLDYNLQMARIYGEQGHIGQMYDSYLQLLENGKTSQAKVLRQIEGFINDEPENGNNQLLRKSILKRLQKDPNPLWNELLSWLFVQQNQFKQAFIQEKALYKRSSEKSLARIENLGRHGFSVKEFAIAHDIFEFMAKEANDVPTTLRAQLTLLQIDGIQNGDKSITKRADQFEKMMATYGYQAATLDLQLAYAKFLTFTQDKPEVASRILKKCLKLPLDRYTKAKVKMGLGDILVYDQRFNQALIQYSQVQKNLKNDVMGQNARFKVAQTSFYKGDFDWALEQLKVLRGSASQLIANDAMQLSLLISDNVFMDSTQTALKTYARADLLAYQNENDKAIVLLQTIMDEHQGKSIEDEALLKQAKLYEMQGKFDQARLNYMKIAEFFPWDILADDANYALGQLYEHQLKDTEKAKACYEKIIYDYQDSYYFPLARKHFRRLRGDLVN
jgi:tetratricopeptide (TPR) repeat protein